MAWESALLILAASAADGTGLPNEVETAWLAKYAPQGFDIFKDGVWITAGTDALGSRYYLRFRDVWNAQAWGGEVWVRSADAANKQAKYRSSMFRIALDCNSQAMSTTSMIHYRADGGIRDQWANPYALKAAIVPASIGEEWAKIICWRSQK